MVGEIVGDFCERDAFTDSNPDQPPASAPFKLVATAIFAEMSKSSLPRKLSWMFLKIVGQNAMLGLALF